MVSKELRLHAVDRIDGATLELLDVTGDYLGSVLDIRDEDGDLVLLEELAKPCEGAVSDFETSK